MGAPAVTGVDAPPVLEADEYVLDLVALTVEYATVVVLDAVLGMRWNAGRDALVGQGLPKGG